MRKMILVLVLSFGSVILGYIVQRLILGRERDTGDSRQRSISDSAKWIKVITLGALLPWPILFTFWQVEQVSSRFALIPVLGATSLLVGGLSAIFVIRKRHMDPRKAGALFSCGMMTNLGIIGGLIGMVFLGNEGFFVVQLFTMFEAFIYYLVVFPLAQQIGSGGGTGFQFNPKLILSKPMSMVPLSAIIIGLILNLLKVPAPEVLNSISSILVPAVTGLIGFSIGLTLRISKVRDYRRESALIAAIKFIVIPAVIIPLAALLGIPELFNGTAFKMIIILSFGPVALIAMVPPQLYDLDLDLANSGWLVTTVGHLVIVPILILLFI